jgi:NAD(P)-dependent dehydrogenase (short-subunit alcohol dehydrogenase family)
MSNLQKKLAEMSAVVTGAAQGLGKALAERLLTEGCSVCISDVSPEQLAETEHELKQKYG